MSLHTILVSEIAPATTKAHLDEFFSFCGKINSIDFDETAESKSAHIHFEKPSAAKTALMLNGGTLDGTNLHVTSDVPHQDEVPEESAPIDQTDKPRAGIAAEYLAKGYLLQDQILQRAIDIDNKQGISKRFLDYFHSFDTNLGARALGPDQTISGKVQSQITAATQQAKNIDEQKGYTKTASDYYTKALSSPLGHKVLAFWTSTSKQVLDIHEEARRIAATHKAANPAAEP
jgi:RNA recognition motif-containing protein